MKTVERQLISVIVPVYNTVDYLDKCLMSLVNQTYKYLEIILIDDGSCDGCADICDKYAIKYENIIVMHTKNGGSSVARNIGLNYSSGDYIGFLDSDDYVSDDFYESMMEHMDSSVDVVSCGVNTMYPDGKIMRQCTPDEVLTFNGSEIIKELLSTIYINFSVCNKVFKKKCFNNVVFPIGKNHEDIPVMYEVAKKCSKMVCINEAKYFYSVRKGSNSRKPFNIGNLYLAIATKNIYNDVKRNFPQYKNIALYRHFEYVLYLHDLICNGRTKKYKKVCLELEKEIRHYSLCIVKNDAINLDLKARLIQAGWESKIDIIKKWYERSEKYLLSTKLFDKWMEKKQAGKQIEQYFLENHIDKIAIYGMSYLGQRLRDELRNSDIVVRYVIDRNAKDIASDIRIITPESKIEPVDAIIVTATYYYDEIKEFLKKKVDYRVISLEDVIDAI